MPEISNTTIEGGAELAVSLFEGGKVLVKFHISAQERTKRRGTRRQRR